MADADIGRDDDLDTPEGWANAVAISLARERESNALGRSADVSGRSRNGHSTTNGRPRVESGVETHEVDPDPTIPIVGPRRAPHAQQITEFPESVANIFPGAQFVAYFRGLKTGRFGEWIFELSIPADFTRFAIPMLESRGVPLSADFQLWQPFVDDGG